jgi:hypothetical protein
MVETCCGPWRRIVGQNLSYHRSPQTIQPKKEWVYLQAHALFSLFYVATSSRPLSCSHHLKSFLVELLSLYLAFFLQKRWTISHAILVRG